MTDRVVTAIGKLDIRLVLGIMFLLVAMLAFESWILVLRKPYMQYQQILSSRTALTSMLSQKTDHSGELQRLTTELQQLSDTLNMELRLPAANAEIAASLMEALDRSAAKKNVKLAGVKPVEKKMVSELEELSFDVEASGAYLQVCEWMQGFGETLGRSATIVDFSMKSIDEGRRVQLTLRLAVYRPQQDGTVK